MRIPLHRTMLTLSGSVAAVSTRSRKQAVFFHEGSKLETRSRTEAMLQLAAIGLGAEMSAADERRMRQLTPVSQRVYGEITYQGTHAFMAHCLQTDSVDMDEHADVVLSTESKSVPLNSSTSQSSQVEGDSETHVFMDLGSGRGCMVLQVHLNYPSISASIGIELSQDRHAAACMLHERVLGMAQSRTPEASSWQLQNGRVCELRCQDILNADLSTVTIIWLANSFMTEEFLASFFQDLATRAPRLQSIGVTDMLSEWGLVIPGFTLSGSIKVPMSWDAEWTAHIYKRLQGS